MTLLAAAPACAGDGSSDPVSSDTFDTCIAAGTSVAAPGGIRRIEDLRVGDEIYAYDRETSAFVATEIVAIVSAKRECAALDFGTRQLRCTSTHPLFDPAAQEYAPAAEWIEGRRSQLLDLRDGEARTVTVTAVHSYVGTLPVYDLTVKSPLHNFVAGGLLVHNKSLATTGDDDDDDDDDGITSTDGGEDDVGDWDDTYCVADGAMIDCPEGRRPIESLRVGDQVLAVDPHTHERVATEIVAMKSTRRECLELDFGGGALRCTPSHPLYDPDADDYFPASEWADGTRKRLLLVDSKDVQPVVVKEIRPYVGVATVHDITVEALLHNFVADGVLVHNKSPPEDTWTSGDETGPGDSGTDDGTGTSGGTDTGTTDGGTDTDGTEGGTDGDTEGTTDSGGVMPD